ncbi:hypothetical protein NM208_g13100 [Fusarium decemcellulare]|uniref:Uncharacterized protein n=1 Tax=Fusarium decemcellulare TaxID=57161 RepID=A0ACC1RLB3_9HYPO|nr:hypothetical protein NM208_g13100 [Fusarium decemcellulare]
MHHLPNELIAHILRFLDSDSNLHQRLYEDPVKLSRPVHSSPNTPLKNASLVCHLWRRTVLNFLFRHVVWSFQRFYKPEGDDIPSQIEVLDFLRRNGLSRNVKSFTIFIDLPRGSGQNRYADGQFWGLLPPESCQPETPMSWNLLWSVLSQESLSTEHGGTREEMGSSSMEVDERRRKHWDNNWLWHAVFDVIDPLRITLISSADIVSSLLSRGVDLSSDWAFNSTYYVLSLSRTAHNLENQETPNELPSQKPGNGAHLPSDLFSIRAWTSLLINEGSFAPVYSTYEFFHYSAPTLLPIIFDATDPSFNIIRTNLQSLSYIATFPLSHHIADFFLPGCPPVEHLYVQLMPKSGDFWESDGLSRVNLSDLWLECDASYSLLMRQILDPVPQHGWQRLKVFETGDAPANGVWSEGVWGMGAYDAYIDGVNGWRAQSEGFFVRDAVPDVADEELESINQEFDALEAMGV